MIIIHASRILACMDTHLHMIKLSQYILLVENVFLIFYFELQEQLITKIIINTTFQSFSINSQEVIFFSLVLNTSRSKSFCFKQLNDQDSHSGFPFFLLKIKKTSEIWRNKKWIPFNPIMPTSLMVRVSQTNVTQMHHQDNKTLASFFIGPHLSLT